MKQQKLQGLKLLQNSSEYYKDFRCGLQDEFLVQDLDFLNTTYKRAQALATASRLPNHTFSPSSLLMYKKIQQELQGNHETFPKEAEGSVRYLFLTDHFLYLSLNLQSQQAVTQQPLGNTSQKRVERVVLSQVSFHSLQISMGKAGVSSQKR